MNKNKSDIYDLNTDPNSYTKNLSIKKQLIDYIYNNIEMSKYRYKLLEYEYDLSLLKENNFLISPNYNGITSLLVFVKMNNKYYSYTVDRRTLSYDYKRVDYEKVRMLPIKIRLDNYIYAGTIIDGVLLYRMNKGIKTFVINDIYYFRGERLQENIQNKMINISKYLEINYVKDTILNDVELIVNTVYKLSDIKKLVNNIIPKSLFNHSIKGIAFYPETTGTKLIYLYNNCTINDNTSIVINTKNETKTNEIKTPNKSNNKFIVFRFKKTDIIDVYELSLCDKKITKDDKTFIKYKKVDIAYIPTKECSDMCKAFLKNDQCALVECEYLSNKDKWLPIRLSNAKQPDSFDMI